VLGSNRKKSKHKAIKHLKTRCFQWFCIKSTW